MTMGKPGQQPLAFMKKGTVSVSRAAKMLGVSSDTVYRLMEMGVLEKIRFTPRGWYAIVYDSVVNYMQHIQSGGDVGEYLERLRKL